MKSILNNIFKLSSIAVLVVFSLLIFFPFIGEVNLFDWHETLLGAISKEMFQTNSFWTPRLGGNYWLEKPPLLFELQLLSYKYIGIISAYTTRLPNAICGFLAVLTIYKIGRRLYSNVFGLLWALIYLSLFLSQLYHKSALLEPWFNFFIFLSLYNISRVIEMIQERSEGYYKKNDILGNLYWSAFAAVGAILTNGIEAYFIIVTSYWVVWLASSGKFGLGYTNIFRWTAFVLFFIGLWAVLTYRETGSWIYFTSFLNYQKNELEILNASFFSRFSFHFIVLLVGCFPASIFAFGSFKHRSYEPNIQRIFRLIMIGCLLVVFFIATFLKVKVVHYSSLAYFPISFLAAYTVYFLGKDKRKLRWTYYISLFIVGGFWAFLLVAVPLTQAKMPWIFDYIQDPTLHQVFSKKYEWNWYEISFGVVFFCFLIISFILFALRKNKTAITIIFFNSMYISQVILIYYLPKVEALAQGSIIEFISMKKNEKAEFITYGAPSYAANYYSDSAQVGYESSTGYLSENIQKPHTIYLISKKSDSVGTKPFYPKLKFLYTKGLYDFYKVSPFDTKN